LPNVIAAILLLAAGSALGQFVGQTVSQAAAESGLDMAPALGKVVSGGIFFVCAMMAVAQLQIDTAIVRIVTSIILGGAALAFGLSFGFGTREIVRNITAGFYARKVLEIGKPLELRGERGTLKSITATHVILEADGREISIANSAVLSHIAKQ
jgi:small-conductance mechanosensitive channel